MKTYKKASGKAEGKAAPCALPAGSMLLPYQVKGDFTDCFFVEIEGPVSLAQFVRAFYRTHLFRMERIILKMALGIGSSDEQVRELAAGTADQFAAWSVEAREPHQVLLCDYKGQTRSWLKVESPEAMTQKAAGPTILYFGSAVIARLDPKKGERSMSKGFESLMGFHTMYSKALLNSARNLLLEESN